MDKKEKEIQIQCVQALALLFQSRRIPGNKHATVTLKELIESGYPMEAPTKMFRDHVEFKIRMVAVNSYSIIKIEPYMLSKKPIDEAVADKKLPIDMSKKNESLKQVHAKQAKKPKTEK